MTCIQKWNIIKKRKEGYYDCWNKNKLFDFYALAIKKIQLETLTKTLLDRKAN